MNAICANTETCSHPSHCCQPAVVEVSARGTLLGFCSRHEDWLPPTKRKIEVKHGQPE